MRISILRLGSKAQGHNPAKVPKFIYNDDSIDRKFHAYDKLSFCTVSAAW
jgi:hypothetical protein